MSLDGKLIEDSLFCTQKSVSHFDFNAAGECPSQTSIGSIYAARGEQHALWRKLQDGDGNCVVNCSLQMRCLGVRLTIGALLVIQL